MKHIISLLCLCISSSVIAREPVVAQAATLAEPPANDLDELLEMKLPGSDAPTEQSPLAQLQASQRALKEVAVQQTPVKPQLPAAMRAQMEAARSAAQESEKAAAEMKEATGVAHRMDPGSGRPAMLGQPSGTTGLSQSAEVKSNELGTARRPVEVGQPSGATGLVESGEAQSDGLESARRPVGLGQPSMIGLSKSAKVTSDELESARRPGSSTAGAGERHAGVHSQRSAVSSGLFKQATLLNPGNKPHSGGTSSNKDAAAIIAKFKEEKLMVALNEVDRLTTETDKLKAHLDAVLKKPYEQSAVSGALAAWANTYAELEEAEKTVTFLQHLSPEMEHPITMLKASIEHTQQTEQLMEHANFDLVGCAVREYNKGLFKGMFGGASGQAEELRFLKHALASYHAAQMQWYRNVINRMNDFWLLSGGQYIAQKNREITSLDPDYVATSGDDFVSGRDEKEIGWYMTMPLPHGNYESLGITTESLEKQKDDVRTFAGAVNPHELIRQRKYDWERAQKMVKGLSGEAKKEAERFVEMLRQAYERDAGRLEVQTRMKWIVNDLSQAKTKIMSIDDDDPRGALAGNADEAKDAFKVLETEMARFQPSMVVMGDFMLGRFIQGVKKHTKRIEGLGTLNDEVNGHLGWLRKNSTPSMRTAIASVEWALRSQTSQQLL